MKTYQTFAKTLDRLLGGERCVRIHVEGYMPLTVEEMGRSQDGRRLVALDHSAVQNGDLMRDPEIMFAFYELGDGDFAAEPISFRNDFLGVFQEVYVYDDAGRRTRVYPRQQAELRSFVRLWFRNLRDQGFLRAAARREDLP